MKVELTSDPRVAEAFQAARAKEPKAILRLVQMGAEALVDGEPIPFAIIKRPSTSAWARISLLEAANEAASEEAEKAKQVIVPPHNIQAEVAKAAIVEWRGTGAEESLDELFDSFYFFASRVAGAVYVMSGSVAPLVASLPGPK